MGPASGPASAASEGLPRPLGGSNLVVPPRPPVGPACPLASGLPSAPCPLGVGCPHGDPLRPPETPSRPPVGRGGVRAWAWSWVTLTEQAFGGGGRGRGERAFGGSGAPSVRAPNRWGDQFAKFWVPRVLNRFIRNLLLFLLLFFFLDHLVKLLFVLFLPLVVLLALFFQLELAFWPLLLPLAHGLSDCAV